MPMPQRWAEAFGKLVEAQPEATPTGPSIRPQPSPTESKTGGRPAEATACRWVPTVPPVPQVPSQAARSAGTKTQAQTRKPTQKPTRVSMPMSMLSPPPCARNVCSEARVKQPPPPRAPSSRHGPTRPGHRASQQRPAQDAGDRRSAFPAWPGSGTRPSRC